MSHFLEQIRQALTTRNLRAVAEVSGVPYSAVRAIANGKARAVRPGDVDKLMAFLGVKI
jgi:predicted XRE-type DNA-binding protein